MTELTQARLKALLDYSPHDGLFIWRTNHNSKKGQVAGHTTSHGYISIGIDDKQYRAARLAFLWMTGAFPPDQVDHINRMKTDNRWENLRHADQSLNSRNQECRAKSGHKGVYWHIKNKKWWARISINGKTHTLGFFDNPAHAGAAYAAALATLEASK